MTTVLRFVGPLPVLPVLAPWAGRDTALRSLAAPWAWEAPPCGLEPRWEATADGGLRLTDEMPGFEASDVRLHVEGRVLRLTAVRTRRTPHGEEVAWARRTLAVPPGADAAAARARLRLGVLSVEVPPRPPTPPAPAREVPSAPRPHRSHHRPSVPHVEEAQVAEGDVCAPRRSGLRGSATVGWWSRTWGALQRWVRGWASRRVAR
jgi:hypothetical protein